MDGSAGKRCKQHVDFSKSKSKTCMIFGTRHSSEECKVLGGFGTNYSAAQPTNDRGSNPAPKKSQIRQENHAIINNLVDEILLNEPKKVSSVNHKAP